MLISHGYKFIFIHIPKTGGQSVEKDRLVYENLNAIDDYGIEFKIVTPTKFERYFEEGALK